MARMDWSGLDDVFRELRHIEQTAGPLTEKMLDAGAEVIVKSWKDAIQAAGLVDTGAMLNAVRPSRKSKGAMREIYPQGKDSRGIRNAEKAFVNHYGSKSRKIPATGFVDKAEANAEGPAVEVMQKIWDEAK